VGDALVRTDHVGSPFVGFGELQRVLGEGRLAKIFFGSRQASESLAS
jgi:hypothetical protein